jgi:hypothetical protein
MRKVIVVLLALCLTSACNMPRPLEPQKRADIRSIAVISAFGNRFDLHYIGFVVFLNNVEQVAVDWQIDDHVRGLVTAKLQDRYQIVPVPHSPADVMAGSSFEERMFGATSGMAERLRKVVPPGQVDAVVFVAPYGIQPGYGVVEQLEGMGLYNRAVNYRGAAVYAAYRVAVFDGRTFETLASARSTVPPTGFYRIMSPFVRMPWRWAGEPWETLPTAQRDDMRKALLDLLDRTLDRALADVSLTGRSGL